MLSYSNYSQTSIIDWSLVVSNEGENVTSNVAQTGMSMIVLRMF